MTPTEFLRAVAAILPGRPSPARTSALCQFGTKLAHDFRGDFTPALADAVGRALDDFPAYDELLAVVRRCAPAHAERAAPREEREFVRPKPSEAELEEQDRAWWADRIEHLASFRDPSMRWAWAVGMHATLTRSVAWPRTWAIERVKDIIAQAEAEGAETNLDRVVWPHGTDGWQPRRMPTLHGPSKAQGPQQPAPMAHMPKRLGTLAPAHLRAMRERAGIPTGEAT